MHPENIFLTLTYNEESLESPWLIYDHWQSFMKDLRSRLDYETDNSQKITAMVTGEYGEITKRPHWHAIIFNFRPDDAKYKYTTDLKHRVYTSDYLSSIWNKGNIEFGDVTLESAGYVARYASKKLVHGLDQEHSYHPIHHTPKGRALGRTWIERYYEHTFNHGYVVLPGGQKAKIPRYYVDWLKKHNSSLWEHYVTTVAPSIRDLAIDSQQKDEAEYLENLFSGTSKRVLTRSKVKETILKTKFKILTEWMKL